MKIRTLKFWFILTLMLAGSTLELGMGLFGILLPVLMPLVFYVTMVYGWRTGTIAAIGGALWTDLACGRAFPVLLPVLGAVVLTSWYCRRRSEISELPDMLLPALAASGAAEAVWLVVGLLQAPLEVGTVWLLTARGIWLTALGMVIAFFLYYWLDKAADRLGLPVGVTRRQVRPGRRRWPQVRTGR